MDRQTLTRNILCLLMALVCGVAWAQTNTPVKQTSAPADGYYLVYSESKSGSGWVHYDKSLADRKFRVATDVDLSNGLTANQAKFVWKLVNDNENGTFTLQNMGEGVYIPADASRNQNMGATTTANLEIIAMGGDGNEGKWYVTQTNNKYEGQDLYIHTNAPNGYPNLSYYNGHSATGTSIRAQFHKVPETTYTVNYMSGADVVATTTITYPAGLTVPENVINDAAPEGYFKQRSTLEGTIYTVNLSSLPAVSDAPTDGQWAANTTWFQIKNQKNKVIRADALTNEGYLSLEIGTVTSGDAGLWCIVGDAENGYKFYNRAKGADVVLGMTGSEASAAAIFVAIGTEGYTTAFDIVASTDDGYWCVKEHGSTNNYWNQRDPRLAYWKHDNAQKGDDGSAFLFTQVDLATITGLAAEGEVTAAQALIKIAPGYPKTTTSQYRVLNVIANSPTKGAIKTELDAAITAYKTCTDIILPEDGKAYTFTNYSKHTTPLSYLNYTQGGALTMKVDEKEASIFICRKLRDGVYAFVTEDGKILTWMGGKDGYLEGGKRNGYSNGFAQSYSNKNDWNEITIAKHGDSEDQLGLLKISARRLETADDPFSYFIVKGNGKGWDHASTSQTYLQTSGNYCSSAWYITEVEHTNTDSENLALAEIDATVEAFAHVDANASQLGESIGYTYYMLGETKSIDAAAVKTAIYNATTADDINAIKASYKFNIPTAGAPYYLFDETHKVYLDIHHLGAENAYPEVNQMATLSSEPQPLYITASPTDGSWKIHTTYKGGNYLCQYTGGKQTWDSWVSADAVDFNWEVELSIDGEDLCYLLKNTGSNKGYLGCGEHSNGKVLYANQTNDAEKLKLKLVEDKANILTINNLDANGITYPHALTDEQAAKVFGQNSLTIAIDVTMPASLANNTRYALVCGADPTQAAATEATKSNSSYIAYGLNGNYPAYMPSSLGGDKFSYRNESFTGNTTYKVVYVVDKINNKFLVYINGALINLNDNENYPLSDYELQSFGNFSTADGDKLYIGGGIVGNTTEHDKFGGTIHSVKFYNYALTAEEVAAIEYPITDKQQDIIDRTHIAYRPTTRATTLESGKKYMIYNTAFNGNEDRTGFLYDNSAGIGHSGAPKKKPTTFKNINEAYLWEVETTDEEGKYYLKTADGGYVNATGKTDNAEPVALYIQPWNTSTTTKAGVKSEAADGTVTENANIGADVFTIGGTKEGNTDKDCWNGDPNAFSNWGSAHPYAFYEVEESSVIRPVGSPTPGKTYYIYCANDTRQYFYNDGGTLKVSAERTEWSNEYLFTCSYDGEYFQFKNMKGKYLKHQGLQNDPYNFELATYLDGVNLKTPNGSYFVMKANGGFDQSTSGEYDPKTTDYSTIYKFEEFNFPVDGETYYIYSDTYKDGSYVNRYLYNDGDQLKLNTSLTHHSAYVWTCIITPDGHVQFRNGEGKYLKHRGVQDTPYDFTVNKYNSTHAIAATLYSNADGGRYFAVKNDGTAFDQSTVTSNQTTGEWCTDFVFEPCLETKKALRLLIAETQELVNGCYNYYSKEALLTSSQEAEGYYVWANAPQSGEPVGNLFDGDANTIFHSNWESTTAPEDGLDHHITIELGEDAISLFKFSYRARSGNDYGDYPKTIKVQGSTDGTNYDDIATVEPRSANGSTIENGAEWTSDVLGNGNAYNYLRFMVTATTSNRNKDGHIYWHMAEFDLMPRQAEPVSNYPNSILVPSALTAAKEGVANAETTIESILTMDEYETSFAALKVVYDDLVTAIASGNLPVLVSVDTDNPIVYLIHSKRGDTKVLQYDLGATDMVAVEDYVEGNVLQGWYFTLGSTPNQAFIHPYVGGGDVLAAKSTGNSTNAVWAKAKGTYTHQEWTIPVVNSESGIYNIKAGDDSNYFSHNGGFGKTKYMGFWSNDNTTDDGSLFTFERISIDGGIWKHTLTEFVNKVCTEGNVPATPQLGYITRNEDYDNAYNNAATLIAGDVTENELKSAYTALRSEFETLDVYKPEAGKFYRIKSVAGWNDDAPYLGSANSTAKDGRAEFVETANANTIFYFDGSSLLSYGSGLYLISNSSMLGYNGVKTSGTKVGFHAAAKGLEGAFNISFDNGTRYLYTNKDNYTDGGSGTNNDDGYCFTVEEVTSLPVTISSAGYTTLYAPVALEIDADVEAYVVSEIQSSSVLLEQVTGVVPAETGLIIKGDQGEYSFSIGGEATAEITTNELKGTVAKSLITPEDGTTCYVLANPQGGNGVGLYKASLNKDANGATNKENGIAFINNGFKVYLPVANPPVGQAARALMFRFGGTTEIENVETTDNGQQTTVIFDITGRRIEKIVEKGMYIINGKKVVIR